MKMVGGRFSNYFRAEQTSHLGRRLRQPRILREKDAIKKTSLAERFLKAKHN